MSTNTGGNIGAVTIVAYRFDYCGNHPMVWLNKPIDNVPVFSNVRELVYAKDYFNVAAQLVEARKAAANWHKLERMWSKQKTSASQQLLDSLGIEGDVTLPLAEIFDSLTRCGHSPYDACHNCDSIPRDDELPGMWSGSDLTGGMADSNE